MSQKRIVRVGALLIAVALLATACSNKNTPSGGGKGGSIVLGAEQWADCMNPITSCAGAFWQTMMVWQVLPRLVTYDNGGNAQPSPLITELPTLANGGVKAKPFTLTFHLNPAAVWAPDGTPITSKDIEFSWKADMNTAGAYNTVGYDLITGIDTTDPQTAVIHFKSVFVDWIDLFGGNSFGVIEKAAFPNANADKPDLSKELATGPLPFSGGPWIQTAFTASKLEFKRNDKFWGTKPVLDKMTWVPEKDQTTEVADLLSGTIDGAFPQPSNVSILQSLASNTNAKNVAGPGNFYEALWFNNDDPTLKDQKVREAFAYSIDREEIMKGLIHLNAPQEKVLNCGPFSLPGRGPWCDITPWDKYSYQPSKAISILTADGYSCSGVPAKPCTKGGKSLTFAYRFCNGNARRGTTFDLIKEKVKAAGFAFTHGAKGNDCAAPLFTQTLPKGDFQIGDYAQGPLAVDPSPTSNFTCDAVPTAKNKYAGSNYSRYCNPANDKLMKQSDAAIDPVARGKLLDKVWNLMATDLPFLPIYNLPNITIWRGDKLAGPVGDANSNPYGGFINADQWSCVTPPATAGGRC